MDSATQRGLERSFVDALVRDDGGDVLTRRYVEGRITDADAFRSYAPTVEVGAAT
jgi:hypothetical protein